MLEDALAEICSSQVSTPIRDYSVDTELIDGIDRAKQQLCIRQVTAEVNRFFPRLLPFKNPRSNALLLGKTGCPLRVPSGLHVCVPYHFCSVPAPRKDQCLFGNLHAYSLTSVEFERHFLKVSSPLDQSMSLRSLKSSGLIPRVVPSLFIFSWSISNVVCLGIICHSNSIGSPSIDPFNGTSCSPTGYTRKRRRR